MRLDEGRTKLGMRSNQGKPRQDFFEFLGDILNERSKLPQYEIPIELEFVPSRFNL